MTDLSQKKATNATTPLPASLAARKVPRCPLRAVFDGDLMTQSCNPAGGPLRRRVPTLTCGYSSAGSAARACNALTHIAVSGGGECCPTVAAAMLAGVAPAALALTPASTAFHELSWHIKQCHQPDAHNLVFVVKVVAACYVHKWSLHVCQHFTCHSR